MPITRRSTGHCRRGTITATRSRRSAGCSAGWRCCCARSARVLFWVSLIAVIVQFGYVFAKTDLIAHEGAAKVVPFPIVIALIGVFAIWFSGFAARKGWIGQR